MKFLPLVLVAVLLCACQEEKSEPLEQQAKAAPPPPPKLLGVHPEAFDCTKFLSTADVGELVGGDVEFVESSLTPPSGVPRPCTYVKRHVMTDEERKAREKAEERRLLNRPPEGEETMEDVMASYEPATKDKAWEVFFDCRDSALAKSAGWLDQLLEKEGTKEVSIGKRGVEHSDAQILFLDDKTPCLVRITGPDEETRLGLARLVHDRLTMETAPMRPRAAPAQ